MTIAIAQILTKPPAQITSTDNAAAVDAPVAGADFASLLLGQIAADTDLQQSITDNIAPLATNSILDTKALGAKAINIKDVDIKILAPASDTEDASPQDAAMLLAALGIAQPRPDYAIATDGVAVSEATSGIPLAGTHQKASAVLQISNPAQPENALLIDSKATAVLPVSPETDEKAAKFAVPDFAQTKPDALAATNPSSGPNAPTVLAANHQQNTTAFAHNTPLRVETPVRDASWSGDFAQKIVWLTTNDQKFAQLTLNPPQMGPIEISLNINKDSANAYFVSPNAEVREAIETALPRLREMLAGVGIELGQANVSAQSSGQGGGNQETREGTPRRIIDESILGGSSGRNQAVITQLRNGLVDTFA